jgi:tetratricopeptide (TPR) repeat protein
VSTEQISRLCGFAGVLFGIFLANFFYWANFTLSKDLPGYGYSIFGYHLDHPRVVILSFGVIISILMLIGGIACLMHWPRLQYFVGCLAVVFTVWAGCRIVLNDANLLLQLSRQTDWWSLMNGSPIAESQMEPDVFPVLSFETLYDRIFSGWTYLGLGWYAALATGLGLIAGAFAADRRERLRLGTATAVACALMIAFSLARPIASQAAFARGVAYQAEGKYAQSLAAFRRAMVLDRWYGLNPRVYQRMGSIYAAMRETGQPEYKVYLAERLFAEDQLQASVGDIPRAIRLYDELITQPGDFGEIARIRANDMRLVLGWHLFQAGAFGQAVTQWDQVLRNDHYNWLAAYYVGMGYPTVGRYQDLKRVSEDYLSRCSDALMTGLLYNNLGDAENWLGNPGAAHYDYYLSYHIDYTFNTRGASASSGPGVF